MPRQSLITQKTKRRGPPPTGKGELIGVRLQPPLLGAVDAWISRSGRSISRPEAIRRLLQETLVGTAAPSQPTKENTRLAANLAAREIDPLIDKAATDEERASRKRRLIAGPKEFRGIRRK